MPRAPFIPNSKRVRARIAGGTTVLMPDGYHIMLLQTRQPLAAGDRFTCAIAFQKAGTIETEVNVR